MIHDFAVTKNWIVLPVFPLTSSMERAMGGLPPFAWEPDKGSHIAFIPRGGTVADRLQYAMAHGIPAFLVGLVGMVAAIHLGWIG